MTDQKPVLEAPDDPANEQPLVAHLIELRNRLMKSVIAIVVVFACLSPFMKQIFDYLSQPLMVALPQGAKLLATGVVAPFFVPLKVTLFLAFLIALPIVLYQIWAYVAPALYRSEKRLALNRVGFASCTKLKKARPYVIVGAFVIAAIFTPPDALSQILLALPLVVLYQVGIWCVQAFGKTDDEVEEMKEKKAEEDAEG